jgi:hypothetical protein
MDCTFGGVGDHHVDRIIHHDPRQRAGGSQLLEEAILRRAEREIFIDNLPVRVNLIIEMSLVDQPCVTGV